MKNAASAKAVDLGTKRHCPKCSAKFYDFNKADISCPKCGKEIDPEALQAAIPRTAPVEVKRPKPAAEEETTSSQDEISSDAFEELEDLSDAEEVVEDVSKDDEGGEDF